MLAAVLKDKHQPLEILEIPLPETGGDKVLVNIKAAALNRRDYWITKGLYPGLKFPIVPGSDGCGHFDGKTVLINPNQHWGADERVQSKTYKILGLPDNGALAEWVAVPTDRLVEKPQHLTDVQAAALPLAGMTAFRALFTKGQPKPGEKILVTGAGGGVALFVCQFALANGNEVFVTSGSDAKIEKAVALGARGGANYKKENWAEELQTQAGGFDIIVDGAGGEGFSKLLNLCNPAARVVIYGGTQGKVPNFLPQPLFWKQVSILGTTMASDREFLEMIKFVEKHKIVPVVDEVFALIDVQKAVEKMAHSDQFGKIVIEI